MSIIYGSMVGGGGSGGSSITIDETLTEHGKAADAKATGDAINLLSEKKVSLPKADDGSIIPGTAGWYAVSDGLGGDGLDKILDHLEVDVGLQQRQAHLAHGLPDIAFGQASLGAQLFENVIEFVA